jgi:hypothetical protein
MKKIVISLFLLVTIILVYINSSYFIQKQFWKYNRGFYKGDVFYPNNKNNNHEIYFCLGEILIRHLSN